MFVTMFRYCLAGTVGHQLMSGKVKTINLDKNTQIDVQCQVIFFLVLLLI